MFRTHIAGGFHGRFVAFASNASNLHGGPNPDYNGVDDVFVFDVRNGRDIFARDRGNGPYGFGQVSSQGVAPSMTIAGTSSASSPSPFDVGALNVINNKNGLLFYGYAPKSSPFGGGTMLVASPRKRTPVQSSGGNPLPDDTSGVFSYDFNARYWYRDPKSASTTGLSDAVHFVIEP